MGPTAPSEKQARPTQSGHEGLTDKGRGGTREAPTHGTSPVNLENVAACFGVNMRPGRIFVRIMSERKPDSHSLHSPELIARSAAASRPRALNSTSG